MNILLNKIMISYNESYDFFKDSLIVFTDYDLKPIYLNHSKLSDEFLIYIRDNISLFLLDNINAFYLSKQKKGLITYSNESCVDGYFKSIANPLILKDRILGFIGFFKIEDISEESTIYLDTLEKFITNELLISNIIREMDEIMYGKNLSILENKLSERESEIVQMTVNGYKDVEMEQKLFISKSTIRAHLHSVFDKLEINSKMELINLYYKQRISKIINLLT